MFDLWWPAALGARAVVTEDAAADPDLQLPPDDVEAMRQMLAGPAHRQPRSRRHGRAAGGDDRANRRRVRQVQLQPRCRPTRRIRRSSRWRSTSWRASCWPACSLPMATNPRRPRRRSPKHLLRSGSRNCGKWWTRRPSGAPPSNSAATTSRCTAFHSWPRTSSFCEPRVISCGRCAESCSRWPARWPPGWPPVGAGPAPGRSTCARPCANRCPPAACRSTWCCANRARPAPNWWCCATCRDRSPGSVTSPCCWSMPCGSSFPAFGSSPSSTPATR